MAKAADSSKKKKKSGENKPAKGRVITLPNASKELPKSFYQQSKIKRKKGSEIPDL